MSRSAEIHHILTVDPDVSYAEVALRVGCSPALVAQIAKKLDLPTRQGRFTDRIVAALREQPGASYRDIAAELGCSAGTVKRIADGNALAHRPLRHLYDKAAVLAAIDDGFERYDHIAARHGITVGVISGLAFRRRKQLHRMARASRQSTDTLSASGA